MGKPTGHDLLGDGGPAEDAPALDDADRLAAPGEVRGRHEAVVAPAHHHRVEAEGDRRVSGPELQLIDNAFMMYGLKC